MSSRPKWDHDQKFIDERIRWAMRGLIGRFGFSEDDREDLYQDFTLDLLQRLESYDPEKSQRRTFMCRVIENRQAEHISRQQAGIRDYRMTAFSLDETTVMEGEVVDRRGQQEAMDFRLGVYGRFICATAVDEAGLDFHSILTDLPSRDRMVLEAILRGDRIAEISRDLTISRTTVYERIKGIRRRLTEAGFGPRRGA